MSARSALLSLLTPAASLMRSFHFKHGRTVFEAAPAQGVTDDLIRNLILPGA